MGNMKAFIALFALVAAVNADAEAEADPYYAYGAYGGYAGFAGLAGYHGAYAGLPYGAYGYAHPAVGTVAVGPAHVAVKAIEGTVPVAVAAPAALTYHHAGLGYAGLGAYGAYGLGAYGLGAYGAYGAYPYAA